MSDSEKTQQQFVVQKKQASKSKEKKQKTSKKATKGEKVKAPKAAKQQKVTQKVPKKRKQKQSKPKKQAEENPEAKQLVKQYTQKQNRPYNLLNIFDNLHGKIKKPALQLILNELVQEKHLTAKEFGKNKLYFYNQQLIKVNKETIDELGHKFNELKHEQTQLYQNHKTLLDEYKKLMSKKTSVQLQANILGLKQEIKGLQFKKQLLQSGNSIKVDQAVVDQVQKQELFLKKEIKKYKRIKRECLSIWSEITQKKMGQVAQMMGVQL